MFVGRLPAGKSGRPFMCRTAGCFGAGGQIRHAFVCNERDPDSEKLPAVSRFPETVLRWKWPGFVCQQGFLLQRNLPHCLGRGNGSGCSVRRRAVYSGQRWIPLRRSTSMATTRQRLSWLPHWNMEWGPLWWTTWKSWKCSTAWLQQKTFVRKLCFGSTRGRCAYA